MGEVLGNLGQEFAQQTFVPLTAAFRLLRVPGAAWLALLFRDDSCVGFGSVSLESPCSKLLKAPPEVGFLGLRSRFWSGWLELAARVKFDLQ